MLEWTQVTERAKKQERALEQEPVKKQVWVTAMVPEQGPVPVMVTVLARVRAKVQAMEQEQASVSAD